MKIVASASVLLMLVGACSSVPGVGPDVASGDFDGDGRVDAARLVTARDRIVLTIKRAVGAPQTLEFGVGTGAQDAVCRLPVAMTISPASCDAGAGPLPGCVASPGKVDISISDGACDAIHLYWDASARQMAWWRL